MNDIKRSNSNNELVTRIEVNVCGKKVSWWAGNHITENARYVEGLSTEYARFKLRIFSNELNKFSDKSEKELHLYTMSLRQLYVEVLESTMASMMAFLEAPHAIPIWLASYKNQNLESTIADLQKGKNLYAPKLSQNTNIYKIADYMVSSLGIKLSQSEYSKILQLSSSLATALNLSMLDYGKSVLIDEYNSIKHGHRAILGGSELRIALMDDSETQDTRPPEQNFSLVIGGKTGITFPVVRRIRKVNKIDELSLEDTSSTANPEKIVERIRIVLDIQDVIFSAMKFSLGVMKDVSHPDLPNSLTIRSYWLPEKHEGIVSKTFQYNLPQNPQTRSWGFSIIMNLRTDPNSGLSAFTTDFTDLLIQYAINKDSNEASKALPQGLGERPIIKLLFPKELFRLFWKLFR